MFHSPTATHSFIVLHYTIERVSHTLDTHAIITSPCEPLAITQTFKEANKVLDYYKKKITSRQESDAFSLCFWYETIDGVDIARVPKGRNVVEEVRLRVVGADVLGKEGREGGGRDVDESGGGDGEARKGGEGGERDATAGKGFEEGQDGKESDDRDVQSGSWKPSQGQGDDSRGIQDIKDASDDEYVETDQSVLHKPHPEGQDYDFGNTRLRLRSAPPRWDAAGIDSNSGQSSHQPHPNTYADVPTDFHSIPILRGLRASSIDGRVWTTKYEGHTSDGAHLRWMAHILEPFKP